MFEICANGFNRTIFIDKEGQIKAPLVIAINIIVLLSGLFFILAYYQVLPYGANCISNLGPGGLGLGWGLLGLDLAFLIYIVKKSCSHHPIHTQNLEPQNNIIEDIHSSVDPSIASQSNKTPRSNNYTTYDWNLASITFHMDLQESTGQLASGAFGMSSVDPEEHQCSDLFSLCKKPNVCFLSVNTVTVKRSLLPIQEIKDAFAQGKKMVFVMLSTGHHSFALGLCVDGALGKFKIIDSCFSNSINCVQVANALNQAGITNPQGKQITFSGEYINTHIQQGGNECTRFATLYCYHMAERQDLEAYQEVNGAFLEGRLLRFEDYQEISKADPISSLRGKSYTYESFMHSWRYRMLGFTVDAWEKLSFQEILAKLDVSNMDTRIALLSKRAEGIPPFMYKKINKFFIQVSSKKIAIDLENLQNWLKQVDEIDPCAPVDQSLNLEENEFLLIWKPNSRSFEVFKLEKNQIFLAEDKVETGCSVM